MQARAFITEYTIEYLHLMIRHKSLSFSSTTFAQFVRGWASLENCFIHQVQSIRLPVYSRALVCVFIQFVPFSLRQRAFLKAAHRIKMVFKIDSEVID